MQAKVSAGAESRAGGDVVDAKVGCLQQFARGVDAGPQQPLKGGVPGVLDEAARERPVRHVGVLGEVADGEVVLQPGQRPRPGAGEGLAGFLGERARDILSLAAAAVRGRDDLPGDVI